MGDTAGGGLPVRTVLGQAVGQPTIGSDIGAAMRNVNSSAYVRVPFTVAGFDSFPALSTAFTW